MLSRTLSRRANNKMVKKPKKTIPKVTRATMTTTKMTITKILMTTMTKIMIMETLMREKKFKMRKRRKSNSTTMENAHTLAICTKKRRVRLTL
jgi:hypothetical protein